MDAMNLPDGAQDAARRTARSGSGAQAVLIGTEVPERNRNDWSASLPQTPLAVVRPLDAAGVSDDHRRLPQGASCRSCRKAASPGCAAAHRRSRAGWRSRWSA